MALIQCPECGRKNVSDSAEMCPDCGYGIKAHFEKIRQEEERKEQARKAEEAKRKAEIEIKEREEERIKSVPKPSKPKISFLGLLIGGLVCWLGGCQINTDEWERERSMLNNEGDPVFYGWLFLIIGIGIICFIIYIFVKQIERYNLAQTDFEEYQRQIIKEENAALASAQLAEAARAREEAMKLECPYCHSHNTSKITATAKAVNTAIFGVLGEKRYYQWHCNKCKSDF